ncbi:MAG: AmmeMemoRadiSam system protein A [Planctomycetota bacterium]|nr:AmmeMemoRadiSam system protein A [Planctomycetota bacterium]MDA1211135.1 AmmeMemoRadiSam system protein A [Planctomycetota bacterium]
MYQNGPSSPTTELNSRDREILLDIAEASLVEFVNTGREREVNRDDVPPHLLEQRATFVTLRRQGELRGCMGSLLPRFPLVEDVAHNAFSAAAYDPRFSPLKVAELPGLNVQISLLTLPEPIRFTSEPHLLELIQPGVDGLTLTLGRHRGTLLPSVWKMCPDKQEFMNHLKKKAGLPVEFWDDDIKIERYRTFCWSRTVTKV